jgi:hypothetical protein
MMRHLATAALFTAGIAAAPESPARADTFTAVTERGQFISLVSGRTLNYPGVTLQVLRDGRIVGRGLGRKVSGDWQWSNDGYFCRDLYWGQRDLGANCQKVLANGGTLRFISDRGTGQSADLRLR